MVYADSPHIHQLQSVPNQSKVRDKNREYSKSKQELSLHIYIHSSTSHNSGFLYQIMDFIPLRIILTRQTFNLMNVRVEVEKQKYSYLIENRTLYFLSIQPTSKEHREPGHTHGTFIQICTTSKSNT